ncbi:UNVERIFIED_CONTAM: ATP-dependent DNA helicase, chloroplastic [Sesamum radiatum]|uniref:ATP-dependent DNA helicase, chloroplastic n=1 Tax=Sesamum radiatum TaxID=300843 RepID=A0AAW2MFV6_SESRA
MFFKVPMLVSHFAFQRFGVKQKEKIASLKTSVDVLTLSATPIPRTLYLALTGFRDASLISTPPPERVPIRTHLSAYTKNKVVSAIRHELDRDGQVFYVLPRIKGLEEVMEFLAQSFPNVGIAIAHGKVDEHRIVSVPYQSVQFNMNLNPHLPSEYINYLENPLETINEAENAAEKDIWDLIQFTENLRRQYGKEPYSMEILLKKLYVRRMAADLGITKIYTSGKMVVMKTNMSKRVFKLMIDSMASEIHRTSLVFEDGLIKDLLNVLVS